MIPKPKNQLYSTKNASRRTKLSKLGKSTISKAKRDLWKIFSEWVRRRDEHQGCYTCRAKLPWKVMQASHFISRSHNATLFDPVNVRACCFACNIWKRGNLAEFSARLLEEIGLEEFNKLIALGRTIKKFTIPELETLKAFYELRLKNLNA